MNPRCRTALLDRFGGFRAVVEVGIGCRPGVAAALAVRSRVTATDVVPRSVPPGVRFVVDDVTAPDPGVYAGADLVYALNLPPELHAPALAVARAHGAAFGFTTLGGDPPLVRVRPDPVPGDTVYWARE